MADAWGIDAYVGMELSVVPVFQSEIVPKQVRGLIVETYQLMLYVSSPVARYPNIANRGFPSSAVLS